MNRWIATLLIASMVIACGPRQGANTTMVSPTKGSTAEPPAHAAVEGVIDSGGGRGVLCQKDEQSVESLDLYEARELHGLTVNKKLNSEAEALAYISETLADYFWMPEKDSSREAHRKVVTELLTAKYKQIKFLDEDKSLKLIDDSHDVLLQQGCSVVQVAIYYNESSLLINRGLWEKMSWTDRAALLAHEAVYFKARQIGARNSIETRKLVGHLFSEEGIEGCGEGLPEDASKMAKCEFETDNVVSGFGYAYNTTRDGREGVELILTKIGGIQSLFRLSAFFKGNTILDLNRVDTKLETELVTESYPSTTTLRLLRGPTDKKFGQAQITQGKTARTRKFKFTCKQGSETTP